MLNWLLKNACIPQQELPFNYLQLRRDDDQEICTLDGNTVTGLSATGADSGAKRCVPNLGAYQLESIRSLYQ